MINLREQVEHDLKYTLEGEWILPVVLIAPDGTIQTKKKGTDEDLGGQILYNTVGLNPETGQEVIVNKPVVSLRITSLERIPQKNEKWLIKIPITPSRTAEKKEFLLSEIKPNEGGASIGFIRLYLRKAVQS